jgi:eukaryotic-like serine/threonine-protein kinase
MTLAPGTRVGAYEIVAPLGAGGMGEVYRARDMTLGRDVALKILPAAVATDPDRLARFEREAKTLASLNHPHIAQVYGFESAGAPRALAMELVEGDDLAQRVARGPIPLEEALPIARQVAEALEAAHDAGIIHRDLKPANIKVRPDGTVKVLDFGLAKALDPGGARDSGIAATMTSPATMTAMGVILGTAAYMAPEQARGKLVDRRADIWAFGVVLFEMLTGASPFHGDTVSDSVAAVLTRDLQWAAIPQATPDAVRALLRRCLERDPRRRLQAIGEARVVLENPGAAAVTGPDAALVRRVGWPMLAAAAAAAVALFAAGWLARPSPRAAPALVRKVDLAIANLDASSSRPPMISPDGSRLAYVAGGRLRVRRLDSLDATELPDSDGIAYPSWSPDSRSLAYVRRGRAWKIAVDGGPPTELGAVPADLVGSAGSTWTSDGQVVFAGSDTVGLWTLPGAGGSGRELIAIDRNAEADFHEVAALPNGRGLLFTVHRRNKPSDLIAVLSGGSRRVVLEVPGEGLRYPIYSPTGHVLYERATTNPGIWAVPFSLDRLEATGAPFLVVPHGSSPTLAGDGTLCFVRTDEAPVDVVSLSRSGAIEKLAELTETTTSMVASVQGGAGYRAAAGMSLSPDGTRVAVSAGSPGQLVVFDLARGSVSHVATGSFATHPVWTAGSDRLIYGSAREARAWNLWSRRADGAGDEQRLSTSDEVQLPLALSPDGSTLVFSEGSGPSGSNVQMPLAASAAKKPLFASRTWGTGASFSPDGRWLAYEDFESGRTEIFVRPFPAGDQRIQISSTGGEQPVWSKRNEIFYLAPAGMSSVSVTAQGGSLAVSKPVVLFPTGGDTHLVSTFAMTPDGQRFFMLRTRGSQQVALIFNWPSDFAQ